MTDFVKWNHFRDKHNRSSSLILLRIMVLGCVFLFSGNVTLGQPTTKQSMSRPNSVDLRPKINSFGLTPRAQGKRGTCSVFAFTQAMEFTFARRYNQRQRFSVEFLNWASNKAIGDSADGSFFSDLWTGFTKYGICNEGTMPYKQVFDTKVEPSVAVREEAKTRRNVGLQLHWIKEWNPKRGLNDDELNQVLDVLSQGWPVCGGFLWPKKTVWKDSVLEMCPREQVFDGHSLLLVGYRDDPKLPGGGVLLLRNSGGKSRDGMLTYEYVKAYMNDAVWINF
jgi:hypothetical protein